MAQRGQHGHLSTRPVLRGPWCPEGEVHAGCVDSVAVSLLAKQLTWRAEQVLYLFRSDPAQALTAAVVVVALRTDDDGAGR